MKKFITSALFMLLAGIAVSQNTTAETTIRRFSFGADIFTDMWMNWPEHSKVRTINQGVNVFGMYNYPFKPESNFSFAFGVGMGFHNMYSNSVIKDVRADSIVFQKIPDSTDYRRTKMGLTYIDVPLEFRFKSKSKFRIGIGFKIGYLIDAKDKYKGNNTDGNLVNMKRRQIDQTETFRFGPTLRVGYHWFSFFAYYQLSPIFQKNKGPKDLYPISIGITLLPF